MSRHRFFLEAELPPDAGGQVVLLPLSDADVHHAVSVLRVRAGEELDVVSPSGRVARVTVDCATTEALTARQTGDSPVVDAAAMPKVTLVFGVSKGSKNDDIVEGAVEVGAAEVLPVLTARSIVRFDADKRSERGERWRRVALAAAKQSKRSFVPVVSDPVSLRDALPLLAGFDLVLVAWEEAAEAAQSVRDALSSIVPGVEAAKVAVVVGPEGGFAGEEIEALTQLGAVVVTLGATILRAETAAVVTTALVIHELGGLGNAR